MSLNAQGAKIDAWGIGTKAITAFDQPALGAVYRLVAIEDDNGKMTDTIKISASPEKVTTPGLKKAYRIINNHTKKSEGDYIALANEQPEKEAKLYIFHPVHTYIGKFAANFTAKDLHVDIFDQGTLVYECPQVQEIQSYAGQQLNLLWEEYKRSLNPADYPVVLSQACWDNKMKNIEEAKKHNRQSVPL
jgi:nicotinate phosphoribosyltransferase